MVGENGTPETPEWVCEPRGCPFEGCDICNLPERFELGEN